MLKRTLIGLSVVLLMLIGTNAWAEQLPQQDISINVDIASESYEASNAEYRYIVSDGQVTITRYRGPDGEVVIPDTIEGYPVVTIGDFSFRDRSGLLSITFPDSVTTIEGYAFYKCSGLTDVTIPDSVVTIGGGAFGGCSNLTSILVDAGNLAYSSQDGVLYDKDKIMLVKYPEGKSGEFTIPDSVATIGGGAFSGCSSLTSIAISESVTSISPGAFSGCSSLASVILPNSITAIKDSTFLECTSLTGIIIPDSVTSIGDNAFYGCSGLTSVTIGNSVTSIGTGAFIYCSSLTSITIPDSVTRIGVEAFSCCSNLTSVTIPDSVATIGGGAFLYCSSLACAYFAGDAPVIGDGVFYGTAPGFNIRYVVGKTGFVKTSGSVYPQVCSLNGDCYPAAPWLCSDNGDCPAGSTCVDGQCTDDFPPSIDSGPFLAAGYWPVLPSSADSPIVLAQDYDVYWTFSDDYATCSGFCTHTAEYKAVGGSTWTPLAVSTDPTEEWYAYTTLPVADLTNATTYVLRFTVTDCLEQSTQSGEYYFRVSFYDNPPVIESGPFLAAGYWPVLPRSELQAHELYRNLDVLWTFSDDYDSCLGDCTHRARYRAVGELEWNWLGVDTDPTGEWYAYTTLPVENLSPGAYQFHFDVQDCAGQRTNAPSVYYFKRAGNLANTCELNKDCSIGEECIGGYCNVVSDCSIMWFNDNGDLVNTLPTDETSRTQQATSEAVDGICAIFRGTYCNDDECGEGAYGCWAYESMFVTRVCTVCQSGSYEDEVNGEIYSEGTWDVQCVAAP